MTSPNPTDIKLHQQSKVLAISFDNGEEFNLPCEYLRVYSRSAEVAGHSPDEAVLQVGKQDVNIIGITPMGNYAIRLEFDDGHDSGIYSWSWLYDLGKNYRHHWQDYLDRLKQAGHSHREMNYKELT